METILATNCIRQDLNLDALKAAGLKSAVYTIPPRMRILTKNSLKSPHPDSNQGPAGLQPGVLPLHHGKPIPKKIGLLETFWYSQDIAERSKTVPVGTEPTTFRLTAERSTLLSYGTEMFSHFVSNEKLSFLHRHKHILIYYAPLLKD